MALTHNTKGALLMVGSMTAFTVNDAFFKALSDEVPLFQGLFLRGIGVVALLLLLCHAKGQLRPKLDRRDWRLILLRSTAEAGAAWLFLTALFNMRIANVSAILQALPLTVSLAGAVFLGEALGWRRLTAILIGFVGVLLIIQPGGEEFNIYSLAALGAVALVTVRDLAARRLSQEVPSVFVALFTGLFVTAFAAVGSLFVDWQPLSAFGWFQLGCAVLFVIGGYIFSVAAMRVGELSIVAPFRYTSLLVALILGVVFFGEWPGTLSLIGAAIVVATGLFTLYREARTGKIKPTPALRMR